jgi:hypothetical protein
LVSFNRGGSDQGWQEVREGIKVKFVKCLAKRMEEGLEATRKSAEKGRLKDVQTAGARLGRLREKNWRASGCFDVKIGAST